MRSLLITLVLLCCTHAFSAIAARPQDLQQLRVQAAHWLEQQAVISFPDARATVSVGPVDARLRLPACNDVGFFLTANATLWGRGSLGARCAEEPGWTLYLSYESRLRGPGLVAARPLPTRAPLGAADVIARDIDYTQSPHLYPRELPAGAVLKRALAADQAIQVDWLMLPNVIRAGQRVKVRARGAGFVIAQEGVAQNAAAPGDVVRVRVPSGRIVQGIADGDGVVEVR